MSEIHIPSWERPKSALDGLTMMAIDTDPEDNLALLKYNAPLRGLTVVSAEPWTFRNGRRGYVVVVAEQIAEKPKENAAAPPASIAPENIDWGDKREKSE